jgi:DNA-binding NtrC family response regulator
MLLKELEEVFEMKILIIDDERDLLKALGRLIRNWGGDVRCAASAAEGISELRRERFDFILLDVRMPEHDAVWFLKHAPIPETTHTIIMSGFAPASLLRHMRELGARGYLEKPFNGDDLMCMMDRVARKQTRHAGFAPAAIQPAFCAA